MKLLILSSKCGNGHNQAGISICERLNRIDGFKAENIDVFDIIFQNFSKAFYKGHDALALSKGYSFLFNAFHKSEKSNELARRTFVSSFIDKFKNLIEDYRPDIIISTYSMVNDFVAYYKHNYEDIPLITWVTDVKVRNFWVNPYIDAYIVADTRSKLDLLRMGVNEGKIYIGGIPVSEDFVDIKRTEPEDGEMKKLLLMGGGLGMFPNSHKLFKELNDFKDIDITVITGKNKSLHKHLKKFENLTVLPFAKNTHKMMASTNLLVTKPGGLTIFEAIYSQTPMLLFKPELDQEIYNMEYIIEKGCGDVLREDALIEEIYQTLSDDNKLRTYKENCIKLKESIEKDVLIRAIEDVSLKNTKSEVFSDYYQSDINNINMDMLIANSSSMMGDLFSSSKQDIKNIDD
ncbi:MAG: glycosyltransferase [Finegoldia sp.]|nr:glycosyltransferase [Finegoldia sp.]